MLVRSASTPILGALHPSGCHSPAVSVSSPAVHFPESPASAYHPSAISCRMSGGAGSDHERLRGTGIGMRRTSSEGNLASMARPASDDHHHHLPPRARPAPPLETIQSFTNRDDSTNDEEEEDAYAEDRDREMCFGQFDFVSSSAYTQEHPLFLARGLGIDRLGSGLLSADGGAGEGGVGGGGSSLVAFGGNGGDRPGIEMHYKKMIEEDPLQRPRLEELRTVSLPGERGLREGRGVLLPSDTCRPKRRRAPVRVRQAGLGRAPRRRACLQLLRAGRQGFPAEQPCPRRTRRVPVGHGRRRRTALGYAGFAPAFSSLASATT